MKSALVNLLKSGDMSGTLTSVSERLQQMYGFAVQCVYTGSPNGTLVLNASNDNINWAPIANTSTSISGAGNTMFNIPNAMFQYVQCVYTFSSGTGSLDVKIFIKGWE